MKATVAYTIAAALFGATQAAITPLNRINNIIRHEYNMNARAGVHGNIERDEVNYNPAADDLHPVV